MSSYIDVSREERFGRSEPFVAGGFYFDHDAKEVVRLSNGTCVKTHKAGEALHANEGGPNTPCLYAPSEAVALRVVGVTSTRDPIVAFTYRAVRPEALTPVTGEARDKYALLFDGSAFKRSRFVGRV